jgi:hypothetical protein
MTTMEEFALIEIRLGWLEQQLRTGTLVPDQSAIQGAIDALACARALIAELAVIGSGSSEPETVQTSA